MCRAWLSLPHSVHSSHQPLACRFYNACPLLVGHVFRLGTRVQDDALDDLWQLRHCATQFGIQGWPSLLGSERCVLTWTVCLLLRKSRLGGLQRYFRLAVHDLHLPVQIQQEPLCYH